MNPVSKGLMERSCKAAFVHNIKQSDPERQHAFCSTGRDSWCSYQKDKYNSLKQKIDPIKNAKRLDSVSKNALYVYNF